MFQSRWFDSLAALALGVLSLSPAPNPVAVRHTALTALPSMVLWAWERPEDLRHLPTGTGVAFLVQTITVAGQDVAIDPRRQPLQVDPSLPLIAVTRIESPAPKREAMTGAELSTIVTAIARTATMPNVRAVQIDFDATVSQRPLYLLLLRHVRSALRHDVPLSITALASWCAGDRWLDAAPVDEVVPMLFRMGPSTDFLKTAARSTDQFDSPCRAAIGASLDEPITVIRDHRRVYLFSPKAWTPADINTAQLPLNDWPTTALAKAARTAE